MRRPASAALLLVAVGLVAGCGSRARPLTGGLLPAWSPDGSQLVFETGTRRDHRLVVANAVDGSGSRVVATDLDTGWGQLEWAPAHRVLAQTNNFQLGVVDPVTGRSTVLGADSGERFGLGADGRFVVLQDGDSYKGCKTVGVLRLPGGHTRPLARPARESDWPAALSPEGGRVVYVHSPCRENADEFPSEQGPLSVRAVARGRPVALGVSGTGPRWSPDGRWIAFLVPDGRGFLLETIRPSGGRPRRLVRLANRLQGWVFYDWYPVSWAPDSTRLAYATADGIETVDLAGRRRSVARLSAWGDEPKWSPDGRRLAFTAWAPDGTGVFVVGADGHGLRRLA